MSLNTVKIMRTPYCILCLLGCVLITSFTHAQNENLVAAMEKFKVHFNAQEADSIYAMASPSFKTAIDSATLNQVMEQYYNALGPIDSLVILRAQGSGALFNGFFEKGQQDVAINLNTDNLFNGFRFVPTATENAVPKMERNKTQMQFPLKGDWYVFWGGDTKAQNYHVVSNAQRRAFDLVIVKDGKTYTRSGTRNEDYYAFGKPMTAVCDAKVVEVITGVPDNRPGVMNSKDILGNSVTLLTPEGEYIVYAHFEQGTIQVQEGDMVQQGQYLGNCGNSGNSSEPHLHLHIQDGPSMLTSVGIKCYFESLLVDGALKTDYSPVQNQTISPANN